MRRQLLPAIGMVLVFTVLTGLVYPARRHRHRPGRVRGQGRRVADRARRRDRGLARGSASRSPSPSYFHPRPSATGYTPGPGYAYGSNEGPTSDRWLLGEDDGETDVDESDINGVDDQIRVYREENGLDADAPVPVDAVTGSASSLDPHISVANARLQASRVAEARQIDVDAVLELVAGPHRRARASGSWASRA